MKAFIERSGCIGCGICESTCPVVFALDEENIAKVLCDEIPMGSLEKAIEAAKACPASVITVE